MIITQNLNDAKFIMSKDELTYSEVLDDFKNAERIHILTYNISKKQNALLTALKNCNENTEICIVSNIPNRWDNYCGSTYADNAKKSISLYKSKLSPERIAEKAEVYFCFSNHAKIIMTDNVAYIGSSNFSEESADNFESGFISRDSKFIEFLQDEVFPWIIDYSSEYKTDEELLFIETAIRKSISSFCAMYQEYHQIFYLLSDHRGVEVWYYNTTTNSLNLNDIKKTQEILEQYLSLLNRVNKIFELKVFSEKGIPNLNCIISDTEYVIDSVNGLFTGNLYNLAQFREDDYVADYLYNCPDAYDEGLDYYISKAMNEASDELSIIAESAKEEADSLLKYIKDLESISIRVLELFKQLPIGEIKIDNTK